MRNSRSPGDPRIVIWFVAVHTYIVLFNTICRYTWHIAGVTADRIEKNVQTNSNKPDLMHRCTCLFRTSHFKALGIQILEYDVPE